MIAGNCRFRRNKDENNNVGQSLNWRQTRKKGREKINKNKKKKKVKGWNKEKKQRQGKGRKT